MKQMKSLKIILILVLSTTFIFAQAQKVKKAATISSASSSKMKPVPIDTHPNLIKLEEEMAALVKAKPEILKTNLLSKATNVDYSVGDTKTLWAYNTDDGTFYQTATTCRSVGTYCDVFVEDSVWETRVTQTVVDNVIDAFDNSTPANSSKGIYTTVTDMFGDCPDVDDDGKIIILILNIRDGYTPSSGSYTAGYFYSVNEYSQAYLNQNGYSSYKSNEAEIFYMDCNPANLTTESGLEDVLSTTAHEFQHMVHWTYHQGTTDKPSQPTFFNEGCSQLAPYFCGYGLPDVSRYLNSTNNCSLTDWNSDDGTAVLIDYSRCTLYFLYLYEQFGEEFISDFVKSSSVGLTAINTILSDMGESRNFQSIFKDWSIANALNDKSVDTKWGYDYDGELDLAEGEVRYSMTVNESYDVYSYASQYVTYENGENISITPTTDGSYPIFKAVEISSIDGVANRVFDVSSGGTFEESEFGSKYDQIKLIAINNNSSSGNFTVSSSGSTSSSTIELSYDADYEESYYGNFTSGSKQAVIFEGVNGGTLSSIKVKLKTTDAITGQIYSYTGTTSSPLGTALTNEFQVTADSAGAWVEKPFTDEDIDVSDDFIVLFNISSQVSSSSGNCVLFTLKQSESFENSLFYVPGSSSWVYYYTTIENESYIYLNRLRAYVSVESTTDVDEGLVEAIPKEFTLNQNYPNPFNPSTTINFTVPVTSDVKVTVYNVLGEVVSVLADNTFNAGTYSISFDAASKLSSGIYLYRISAGGNDGSNFVQTKKMMLIK
ncbi:MAG: T9SS type A sorting domain-containing protein [Ignavibacteria bacterium]|jgi:hypothetical protein